MTGWTAEQGQSWDRKEKEARKKRRGDLSVPSVAVSGPREEGGRLSGGDSMGRHRPETLPKRAAEGMTARQKTEDALYLNVIRLP